MAQTPTTAGAAEGHLSAGSLEEYSLDKLSEFRNAAVEEHVLTCALCRARLEAIEPTNFVHFTDDGPIFSRATKLTTGWAMARHWGKELDGYRVCVNVSVAKSYLTQSFFQMFPEHRCGIRCGRTRDRGHRGPVYDPSQ